MKTSTSSLWTADASPTALGRQVKTSERVASAILELIIERELQAGDRLPNEAEMIEHFDVGRGSLREALRILETFGLIVLRSGPGGGPVLLRVNPRDVSRSFSLYLNLGGATLEELAEARLLLEPLVARKAAESLTPESAEQIRRALDREAGDGVEPSIIVERANDFHYTLALSTGNTVLNLLATALKEMYTSRLVNIGLAEKTTDSTIRHEHAAIGEAVIAGDADLAERLAREHFRTHFEQIKAASPGFVASRITWA
jgi:GntR family transcriptional repressor for pyruvate dehydrogenase complex